MDTPQNRQQQEMRSLAVKNAVASSLLEGIKPSVRTLARSLPYFEQLVHSLILQFHGQTLDLQCSVLKKRKYKPH